MKQEDKIKTLAEFKELQELKSRADKRIKELKDQIQKEIDAGKYGDYMVAFERREVKSYVIPARIDSIIKVMKV